MYMLNSPERHNENILKYNMININDSLILSNKLVLDTIKNIHYTMVHFCNSIANVQAWMVDLLIG